MRSSFVLILGALLLAAGNAQAISRYPLSGLTCEAARALVQQEGAVIFRFPSPRNRSHVLYDRFVHHGGHCTFGETTVLRSVPAADGSCALLICQQRSGDDPLFRRGFGD